VSNELSGGRPSESKLCIPGSLEGYEEGEEVNGTLYIAKELSGRTGSTNRLDMFGHKSEKDRFVTGPSLKVDKKAVDMKNATTVVLFG
jgi:hypothetical protein